MGCSLKGGETREKLCLKGVILGKTCGVQVIEKRKKPGEVG